MVDNEDVDMTDPLQRFCISGITLKVAAIGMDRCVRAWNNHYISGEYVWLFVLKFIFCENTSSLYIAIAPRIWLALVQMQFCQLYVDQLMKYLSIPQAITVDTLVCLFA